MGVYIKNMEMPPVGRILIVFPSGRVLEVSADETQNIFRGAQAVPIPEHGDLIDRDANLMSLRKVLYSPLANHETIETAMLRACIKVFEEAPTIIPVEKEHTIEEYMYGQEGNPSDGSM